MTILHIYFWIVYIKLVFCIDLRRIQFKNSSLITLKQKFSIQIKMRINFFFKFAILVHWFETWQDHMKPSSKKISSKFKLFSFSYGIVDTYFKVGIWKHMALMYIHYDSTQFASLLKVLQRDGHSHMRYFMRFLKGLTASCFFIRCE